MTAAAPAVRARDDASSTTAPLLGLSRSRAFIPELESLRGIAVLLVLAFHVDMYVRFPVLPGKDVSIPLAFVRAGYTGVDLFFLLSGFLLSLPFLRDAAGGKRVVVRDYAARRMLRILPLYWVAVVTGTALWASRPGNLVYGLPYLVFLNSLPQFAVSMNPYSAVWWSLATEAQFYLLLPVLLLGRWRAGRVALAVLFAVWVVAYVTLVRGGINLGSIGAQMALHNSVFGRGPLFLCGIAAAAVYWLWGDRIRAHLAARRWFRNGGADVLLLGVLLALGALLQWVVAIGPARQQGIVDQHWHATTGVLWACVLLLVLLAPLRTKLLFSNAILGQLGILSYSIYMIHSPLIFLGVMAVRRTWPFTFDGITPYSMAMLAALILLAIGLSALSYRVIERPFLVRKARFDT